jgi:cytochrome c
VKRARAALICCVVGCAASMLLARVHPFGDAGLYAVKTEQAGFMDHSSVPPEVRAMLSAKCANCHSVQTEAPIYGRFAPASWLMERDIVEARRVMNLSLWDTYSVDQQQTFSTQIVRETREHKMPPPQYRLIHWNSRVTGHDLVMLAAWARNSEGPPSSHADSPSDAGDPTRGEALFEKRCSGCHSLTQNHQGPRLQGVYGRTSGSVADYDYSSAVKKANVVWDQTTLDKWLTDPDSFIPGNNMDFLDAKPQERQDLISYLKQISGK